MDTKRKLEARRLSHWNFLVFVEFPGSRSPTQTVGRSPARYIVVARLRIFEEA